MTTVADPVRRRVMFVLELADPLTGALAGAAMTASVEGFAGPVLTRAGQFAWTDVDPPAPRAIRLSVASRDGQFAGFEEVLDVPARAPKVPVMVVRRNLRPTGLYRPPPGTLAVAGMLIDDADSRQPVASARVLLALVGTGGGTIRGTRTKSDPRGGFVATAGTSQSEVPQLAVPPAADGRFSGWLEVTIGADRRRSKPLNFRQARLNHLDEPLIWADLANLP